MNDAQYLQTQKELLEIAEALSHLDLPAFVERIELAMCAGPVLNPTLYRAGASNLMKIKRIAEAAQSMQLAHSKFLE